MMSGSGVEVAVVVSDLTSFLVTVSIGDTREPAAAQRARVFLDFQMDGAVVQDEVWHSVGAQKGSLTNRTLDSV